MPLVLVYIAVIVWHLTLLVCDWLIKRISLVIFVILDHIFSFHNTMVDTNRYIEGQTYFYRVTSAWFTMY